MKIFKLAIVHDDFIQKGGAEFLVLDLILELQKTNSYQIEVFSSVISFEWEEIFKSHQIKYHQSFLGKIPFAQKFSKVFFFGNFFYYAFESFDFSDFDVVFSSSTRFGHSVVTKPTTFHISYINSPSKMLWEVNKYFYSKNLLYKIIKYFLPKKRIYDYITHQRADQVISNSLNIQKKVRKNYQRDSFVLYPFKKININTKQNIQNEKKDFYLLVSRIVPWKRIDYVIHAFNELGLNLKIAGVGDRKYLKNLKSISKENIEFLGYVTEAQKLDLMRKAKFGISPQDEDFGLTNVEFLACGTPVIYFKRGGAQEIIGDSHGAPFLYQDKNCLKESILGIQDRSFQTDQLVLKAGSFNSCNFVNLLSDLINKQEYSRI